MSDPTPLIDEEEPAYLPGFAPATPPAAAKANGPDINDLQLADEEVPYDEAAPAFAFAAPPPESGNPYLCRLKRGQKGLITKASEDGKSIAYKMCHIEVRLLQDKAGRPARRESAKDDPVGFDQATTIPMGQSSRAIDILRAGLKKPIPTPRTHSTVAAALWEALASEPLARVNIQWRARCPNCSDKATKTNVQLVGERNFKQNADGSHNHVWTCSKCGSDVSANWQPTSYLPA